MESGHEVAINTPDWVPGMMFLRGVHYYLTPITLTGLLHVLKFKNHTIIFSSGLDMSFQALDARTLMKQQAYVSSTPGSSLDLEWEHEGIITSFL